MEHESYGKAKFWLLVVDDVTDLCWSYFLKSKSEMKTIMINLIKELNDKTRLKLRRFAVITWVRTTASNKQQKRTFGNYL